MSGFKLLPDEAGPSIYLSTVEIGKEKLKVTEEVDSLNKEIKRLNRKLFEKEEYLRRLSSHPYWCFQYELGVRLSNIFRRVV